jgi:hypothetical protein
MAQKPRAVYMARAELTLFCECGGPLTKTPGGAYLCWAEDCRWKGKAMLAVTMQAAPMYEKRPT